MEERDPEVRKRNQQHLHEISLDPAKSRGFLLESSMITSIRRAEEIC
ncbi:MAG: hypothetical protein JO207_01630 [Verrucomicrobia bacterium]|jgi:3-(3-hydroxy-phenyl)propionate hydroxylase|nr:hypothetical protein [Verrucomicrobiota bacterium]